MICSSWVVTTAKTYAQHRGRDDAGQDDLGPLLARQACRDQADDDGIVAGQDQIDHDDLRQGAQLGKRYDHRRITGIPPATTFA